jgi:hypothetical protein
MKTWVALTAMVLAIAWAGSSLAYENANGVGYGALEVPNPASMVCDGMDDDWGWYDPAYIITPDDMACTICGGGPVPEKDDWDIAIKAGWSPEPDNRLFVIARVVDDTLNLDVTALDDGWNDDDMEIITDPDHSHTYHGDPNDIRPDHQQWTFHIPTPGGYEALGANKVAYMRWKVIPEMQWAITEGYVEAAVHVEPEGARHMATDVTYTYEVFMPLWDDYQPAGYDASTRHILQPYDLIGLSFTFADADGAGRTHENSTHINESGGHDSDYTSEFTMIPIGDYETSVESSSWGAVKALFH